MELIQVVHGERLAATTRSKPKRDCAMRDARCGMVGRGPQRFCLTRFHLPFDLPLQIRIKQHVDLRISFGRAFSRVVDFFIGAVEVCRPSVSSIIIAPDQFDRIPQRRAQCPAARQHSEAVSICDATPGPVRAGEDAILNRDQRERFASPSRKPASSRAAVGGEADLLATIANSLRCSAFWDRLAFIQIFQQLQLAGSYAHMGLLSRESAGVDLLRAGLAVAIPTHAAIIIWSAALFHRAGHGTRGHGNRQHRHGKFRGGSLMKFPRKPHFSGTARRSPFASVFFLLVIFVMLGSVLQTPACAWTCRRRRICPARPANDPVALDAHGPLLFRGQVIDKKALESRLRESGGRSSEPLTLLLLADKAVSEENLVWSTVIARSAGIHEVLWATCRGVHQRIVLRRLRYP